jgi:hypothetical protein
VVQTGGPPDKPVILFVTDTFASSWDQYRLSAFLQKSSVSYVKKASKLQLFSIRRHCSLSLGFAPLPAAPGAPGILK